VIPRYQGSVTARRQGSQLPLRLGTYKTLSQEAPDDADLPAAIAGDTNMDMQDARWNSKRAGASEALRELTSTMTKSQGPLSMEDDDSEEERGTLSVTSTDVKQLSDTRLFNYICAAIIGLSTLTLALQVALIQHSSLVYPFEYLDCLFSVLYTVEVVVRVHDKGIGYFTSSEAPWNVFDFTVTVMSDVDSLMVIFQFRSSTVGAQMCRMFRILRLLRVFRAVRFMGDVEDVILMAGKAMIKLSVLVCFVLFSAGVIATQLLYDCDDPEVVEAYGTLPSSMWSLLLVMTLGEAGAMATIVEKMPSMVIFFVLFIFSACIALISLTPAIFIALNLEANAKERRGTELQLEVDEDLQQHRIVEHIFDFASYARAGSRDSGVSWEDMRAAFVSKRVRELFSADRHQEYEEMYSTVSIIFSERQFRSPGYEPVCMSRHEFMSEYKFVKHASMNRLWQSVNEQRMLLATFLQEHAQAISVQPLLLDSAASDRVEVDVTSLSRGDAAGCRQYHSKQSITVPAASSSHAASGDATSKSSVAGRSRGHEDSSSFEHGQPHAGGDAPSWPKLGCDGQVPPARAGDLQTRDPDATHLPGAAALAVGIADKAVHHDSLDSAVEKLSHLVRSPSSASGAADSAEPRAVSASSPGQ